MDAGDFLSELLKSDYSREESKELLASRINVKNWYNWLDKRANNDSKGLNAEAVLKKVDEIARDDALFGLGVGNNTMYSVRNLSIKENQSFVTSAWFATLGYGLPAGIGLSVSNPGIQVFTISGDGGYAMNMQEIVTQTKYKLPIINIVFTDKAFGFIEHSQIENLEEPFGIKIAGADWAKTAEGMGAIAFTVRNNKEVEEVFEKIKELYDKGLDRPIFVNAEIRYADPFDSSKIKLDPKKYDEKTIEKYKKEYEVEGMPALSEIIDSL